MTDTSVTKPSPKRMTPLWVIASFLSLTETVAGVVATQTGGGVQVALTCFVIGFPVLVFAGFFAILWNRNYVLYPPTEFGDLMDVTKYVGAMRPPGYPSSPPETLQSTVAANLTIVAEVTAGPSSADETKKTQPESPTPEHWFELYHNKQYDLAVAALVKQAETEKTDSGTTEAVV